jgi:hypothetical protein
VLEKSAIPSLRRARARIVGEGRERGCDRFGELLKPSTSSELVLLVFARGLAPQTEAAAVRWAARYVAEVRPAPDAREAPSS